MFYLYVLTIFTLTAAFIFAISRVHGYERFSLYFKVLGSLGFVAIAIVCYTLNDSNPVYFGLMLLALLLGFSGDVFLGLKNLIPSKKIVVLSIGIVLFLLGHIVFTINYSIMAKIAWWVFVLNILGAVGIMTMTKVLKFKLSFTYKVLGYLYSYTISIMLVSAINYFMVFNVNVAAIYVLIGSILFYISDCLLSASYFKTDLRSTKWLNLIVHITYYFAQILLALSVYFVQ